MVYRFRRDPDGVHRLYPVESDAAGADDRPGDHDQPYSGIQRSAFTTREWARLLILRGRFQDRRDRAGRSHDDL